MIDSVNCACVIHGDKYDWSYVEKLYSMVQRHVSRDVSLHVFTEASRSVPTHMIKHSLIDWPGVSGPKKSWWYKMQMFDPAHITGQILYLDLDVIIVDDLNWVFDLDSKYFWTIRDWRYLWRPEWRGINSSVMYWDTEKFKQIWDDFQTQDRSQIIKRYHGDQDFINASLDDQHRQFFRDDYIVSWRWQIKDGGLNFKNRQYNRPDMGSILTPHAKIVVFHGDPKPHEISDPFVEKYWG